MLDDVAHLLMIVSALLPKLPQAAIALRFFAQNTPLSQPLSHYLQNRKGGLAEFLVGPTAMPPLIEIGLGKNPKPPHCIDINEMSGLDSVPYRKGQLFEDIPTNGILAGQRLNKSGQLREIERKQRANQDFRHPAAAKDSIGLVIAQGPIIEGFDIANLRAAQEWTDEADDKPGMYITDITIDKNNDIALELIHRLP